MLRLINKGIALDLFAIDIFQPAGHFQFRLVIRLVVLLVFPDNFFRCFINGIRRFSINKRITFIYPDTFFALLTNAIRIPLRIVVHHRFVQSH